MPFRNAYQRSDACRVLLDMVGLESLWSKERGPLDPEDLTASSIDNSAHSYGQKIMLRVVSQLWGKKVDVHLFDMMNHLDPLDVVAIGQLVSAIGMQDPKYVDEWIETWSGQGPEEIQLF